MPLEDLETVKTSRFCGYFKMEVLGKVDGEHVKQFIKKNADGDIVLFTDNNTAYSQLENIVDTHFTVVSGKDSTNDTLKWMHNYLNEFVYKLNRRYFGDRLFDRLIVATIHPYGQ